MKIKPLKKFFAVMLCLCLTVSFTVIGFAKDGQKTDYPFIYVHGMCGWGEGAPQEEKKPYWGTQPENNVITFLRSKGYTVFNPTVGGYSSAWDRACELYAQLTGTVVDYGAAHSKEYGHDRYGRDYTGRATMGEPWNLESPLNLVGHSFGGETIRLFASLLAYGDDTEKNADAESCSELFKGGHEKGVYSVTTISSPHNGSTVANYVSDTAIPAFLMVFALHAKCVAGKSANDLMLDQWKITADPATGKKAVFNPAACLKVALSNDHCGYDLTVQGAEKLNKKIKTVKSAYYFSYSACITEETKFGYTKLNKDYDIFKPFKISSPLISNSVNMFIGGRFIDKDWSANDGIVPLKSALYPFMEDHITYDADKSVIPGVWYVMPTVYGADHYDFTNAADEKAFGSLQGFFDFYTNLSELICGI